MDKRRYFLPLAVGVLSLVITGGVIFAQNSRPQENINSQIGTSPEGLSRQISSLGQRESSRIDLSHGDIPNESMASRVAVILGLEEKVVQDAFNLARREKQDDSMAYRLEHLVANEKLTQSEADEIQNWFLRRPDATARLHLVLLRGREAVEYRLNHMVERGVISRDEDEEVLIWYDAMPEALKDLLAQRIHRSPDSQARGQDRTAQRFQGRDMGRWEVWISPSRIVVKAHAQPR